MVDSSLVCIGRLRALSRNQVFPQMIPIAQIIKKICLISLLSPVLEML